MAADSDDKASGRKAEGGGADGVGDLERQLIMQHGSGDIGLTELMAVTDAIEDKRAVAGSLL